MRKMKIDYSIRWVYYRVDASNGRILLNGIG